MIVSGRTPSCFIACAAPSLCSAACQASRLGTSTIRPTRLDPSGSRNVRAAIPSGPKNSSRFGEASQWSTSSTSWNTSNVGIWPPQSCAYAHERHYRVGGRRLLLQPHGFESLLLVVVVRPLFALARPQRADHGIASGKLDAASLALRTDHEQADGSVLAHSPDLHALHRPTLPALHPDPDPFADAVVSSVALGVKTDVQIGYLNVGVHLSEDRLPVVAGLRSRKRFDKPTNYLHVLLRHRLLLEPEVGEGVLADEVDSVIDDLAVANVVCRCAVRPLPWQLHATRLATGAAAGQDKNPVVG